MNGLPANPYGLASVEVFAGASRPVLHVVFKTNLPINDFGNLRLTTLSADEYAWLNDPTLGINASRARYGVGSVFMDEYLVEAARFWASYEATAGYYGHNCPASDPSCVSTTTFESRLPGINSGGGQALDVGAPPLSWAYAQGRFMAEAANCPNGSPIGCPLSESTVHFLLNVDPNIRLVGVGIALNGKSFSGGTALLDYMVEDLGN